MSDRASYNKDMAASLGSKLFFLPHLPLDRVGQFVDFGCADASLLKVLHKLTPTAAKVGVDSDTRQLAAAVANFPEISDLCPTMNHVSTSDGDVSVLILSSVLHELLSWHHAPLDAEASFRMWWRGVEAKGFDYVCIRDFCVSSDLRHIETPDLWVDGLHCRADEAEIARLGDFENRHGSLESSLYSFMHYLLKRPYVANWEREVQENYLALDREALLRIVTQSGAYAVKHARYTRTKKFVEGTRASLGFVPDFPTHAEIVLVRTEWYPDEVRMAQAGQRVSSRTAGQGMDGAGRAGALVVDPDGGAKRYGT